MPKRKADGDSEATPSQPQGAPPPEKQKFDCTDVVTVVVGEEKQNFTVPRSIIISRSSFLEAACKPCWSDGKEQNTIKLPEIQPHHFKIYLQWLSAGELVLEPELDCDLAFARVEPEHRSKYRHLLRLYRTGHYLQDLDFLDHIIDEWITLSTKGGSTMTDQAPYSAIAREAASSLPYCPLRKLIALQYWGYSDYVAEDVSSDNYSEEFKSDLILAAASVIKKHIHDRDLMPSKLPRGQFHEQRDVAKTGRDLHTNDEARQA